MASDAGGPEECVTLEAMCRNGLKGWGDQLSRMSLLGHVRGLNSLGFSAV